MFPLQVLVGGFRAALRRGDEFPAAQSTGPQKGTLVGVPLFHVTGSTSFSVGDFFSPQTKSSVIYDYQDDGHYDWNEDRYYKKMGRRRRYDISFQEDEID